MKIKKLKKKWQCCLGSMTRTELKCWKCGCEAPEVVIAKIAARKAKMNMIRSLKNGL